MLYSYSTQTFAASDLPLLVPSLWLYWLLINIHRVVPLLLACSDLKAPLKITTNLEKLFHIPSSIQSLLVLQKAKEKGVLFFTDRAKNLDKAAIHPINYCTSFRMPRLLISSMAQHFSEFTSIPLLVNKNSRNFPPETPSAHFSRSHKSLQ